MIFPETPVGLWILWCGCSGLGLESVLPENLGWGNVQGGLNFIIFLRACVVDTLTTWLSVNAHVPFDAPYHPSQFLVAAPSGKKKNRALSETA